MTSRQVGEIYSSRHSEYSEATQYCYHNGVHELVLFWSKPTLKERNGFASQPVELALYVGESVLFLLYRIVDICEWSDVAFNIHQLRAEEQTIPTEPPGSRAQMQITLVDADNGIILSKRILSLGPAMTQALRHTLQEQMQTPCSRSEYGAQVQRIYTRYPDPDAMLKDCWMMESASPSPNLN